MFKIDKDFHVNQRAYIISKYVFDNIHAPKKIY